MKFEENEEKREEGEDSPEKEKFIDRDKEKAKLAQTESNF